MIGKVVGNYRVDRELSEGGMSQVYVGKTICRTETLPEGFQVVLKVMLDELADEEVAKKRFVKEAQILSRLRHRYITRFYEFLSYEQTNVLVMEFVDGAPVDHVIAQRGALPVTEAIAVCQALLEALVYAHGKGIVHRDIKPANIIQQSNGMVKVTDFGIAKIKDASASAAGETVLTKSGFLLGTPHYMSPEQIREPREAGAGCDVYSSAVVLYEMLTGELPFNSRSLPKLIDQIYRGDKKKPSELRTEIDSELEDIVLKAMYQTPDKRYKTAREFYEALEEYGARPILVTPMPSPAVEDPPRPSATPDGAGAVKWALVSVRGSDELHDIDGDEVTIGRDRSCNIILTHPAVSRKHATIKRDGSAFSVQDLQSANGTFVNNARISEQNVKPGDIVRFGADPECSYVIRGRA